MSFPVNRPVGPTIPTPIVPTKPKKTGSTDGTTAVTNPDVVDNTDNNTAVTTGQNNLVDVQNISTEVEIPAEFDPQAILNEPEELPADLEQQVDEAVDHNQQVFENTSRSINVKVGNPNGKLSQQHENKAERLGTQSTAIAARESKVEGLIQELETQGLTHDPAYAELQDDLVLLQKTRAVVDATQAVHEELATHKDINRPNSQAELQSLTDKQQKLTLATQDLESTMSQIVEDGGAEDILPAGVQDVVDQGKLTAQRLSDVVELAQNPDVMASQTAIDRSVFVNGMLSQYDSYVELAENGEAVREGTERPHPGRGYINRTGMTPDADGFVVYSRKGKEDADVFAQRFQGVGQDIDQFFAGDDLTPEAITAKKEALMTGIEESFQTESGEYFVKEDRVETVKGIYGDQFDVAHAEYLAKNNDVVVDRLGPISEEINTFFEQDNLSPQDIAAKREEVSREAAEAGESLGSIFGDSAGESFNTNILREFDAKASQYGDDLRVNFSSTDEEVGEMFTGNRTADALNDGIGQGEISGFQGSALSQLQRTDGENIARADAVQLEIDENQGNIETLQRQQSESADRTLDNLGVFLENAAPGTHATVKVGANIKFGVDAYVASAEVKAGIGLSATVEKGSGQGPAYMFHADFHISAEAEAEILFGLFEASAGIEFNQTLAGLAFRTPEDVQSYLNNFDQLITAYQNDDTAGFDAAAERIAVGAQANSYSANTTTLDAEVKLDDIAGAAVEDQTFNGDFPIPPAYRTGSETREYVRAENHTNSYTLGDMTLDVATSHSYSYSDPAHTKPLDVFGSPGKSPSSESHIGSIQLSLDGTLLQSMIAPGASALDLLPAVATDKLIDEIKASSPSLADVSSIDLTQQINSLFLNASADALLASRVSQLDFGDSDDDSNGVSSNAFIRVVVDTSGNLSLDVGFDAEVKLGAGTPGAGWGAEVYGEFGMEYARRFKLVEGQQ